MSVPKAAMSPPHQFLHPTETNLASEKTLEAEGVSVHLSWPPGSQDVPT